MSKNQNRGSAPQPRGPQADENLQKQQQAEGQEQQEGTVEARGDTASLTTLDESPFTPDSEGNGGDEVGDQQELPDLEDRQEEPVQEAAPVRLETAMLMEYANAMAPANFQNDESIAYNQQKLYNAVVRVFTSPEEDSVIMPACREQLAVFRQHKDGAFHMGYIFRGWLEFMRDFTARKHEFEAIITIILAVAEERPVNVDWSVVQSRLQPEHAERTLRRLMAISGLQAG